ncbi:uncharacterized protein L3040_003433 [Drepanopeziza brunnea f. sp. 'multigermtubi']|uniref:Uncharacterized protein n=1 Tax=Marssonina brunnea f. sp. multigermtubi (strain MB_m1) TaxID=1072389 RepID=K1WU58_MARBU|nr:uncharacterized protein MBM_06008 [Drepanopeziza brunnea f. sp. 'multigermtubi' MB_m1]EKD15997.1 hypothetical protein MBM_06008 [Drepanopeziza brunnea f. sp. 'multigermtubi' MB_m1]KAJ5047612.1 hypothetical protein L3040_003433 [Drepanopeziza brunnea f. sp. 'multigermtubi']
MKNFTSILTFLVVSASVVSARALPEQESQNAARTPYSYVAEITGRSPRKVKAFTNGTVTANSPATNGGATMNGKGHEWNSTLTASQAATSATGKKGTGATGLTATSKNATAEAGGKKGNKGATGLTPTSENRISEAGGDKGNKGPIGVSRVTNSTNVAAGKNGTASATASGVAAQKTDLTKEQIASIYLQDLNLLEEGRVMNATASSGAANSSTTYSAARAAWKAAQQAAASKAAAATAAPAVARPVTLPVA